MDSYLLTSIRTPCPRPLCPIPAPFPPPPALSGQDPCPHLVALGTPPPLLLLPGAIPLRSVDTRTQREMVLLLHGGRFVSPSQPGGGRRRGWSAPRAAWGLGDAQLPIPGSGAMCHPLDCLGILLSPSPRRDTVPRSSFAHSPSRSWEKGAGAGPGVTLSSIPTFPTAAFPPKRQLWPLPQSLPCFRGSGRGRAGCDPLVSPRDPKQGEEEPRRVGMSRDTLGDFPGLESPPGGKTEALEVFLS